MPDLMVEARNLAASLLSGLHGRKRAGSGQSFWQFRQYGSGDASSRIDWRRSARGDALFVREMEWESAHTVRLSVDMSSSMRFASPDAREPKRDRAVIMALALSAMLAKGGERVGLIGGERPKTGHAALNTMALELITRDTDKSGKHALVGYDSVKPREDVIILSDFPLRRPKAATGWSSNSSRAVRARTWSRSSIRSRKPFPSRAHALSAAQQEQFSDHRRACRKLAAALPGAVSRLHRRIAADCTCSRLEPHGLPHRSPCRHAPAQCARSAVARAGTLNERAELSRTLGAAWSARPSSALVAVARNPAATGNNAFPAATFVGKTHQRRGNASQNPLVVVGPASATSDLAYSRLCRPSLAGVRPNCPAR
jgi:hypothetical protein